MLARVHCQLLPVAHATTDRPSAEAPKETARIRLWLASRYAHPGQEAQLGNRLCSETSTNNAMSCHGSTHPSNESNPLSRLGCSSDPSSRAGLALSGSPATRPPSLVSTVLLSYLGLSALDGMNPSWRSKVEFALAYWNLRPRIHAFYGSTAAPRPLAASETTLALHRMHTIAQRAGSSPTK